MTASISINSKINVGIPAIPPDAFTDPQVKAAVEMFIMAQTNMLRAIEQYTGASQKDISLWSTLQPSDTILKQNGGRLYALAGEAIAQNAFVNFYDVAGVLKVRNANATNGTKPAYGYCSTVGGVLIGAYGEFIIGQGLLGVTGVVAGNKVFLSIVNGIPTLVEPAAAGNLGQFLGVGIGTDLMLVDISMGSYIQH